MVKVADVSVLFRRSHHYRHNFDIYEHSVQALLLLIFAVFPGLWKQHDTGSGFISRYRCVSALPRPTVAHSCWILWNGGMWSTSVTVFKYLTISSESFLPSKGKSDFDLDYTNCYQLLNYQLQLFMNGSF